MGRLTHVGPSLSFQRKLFPTGFAGEVMQLVVSTWNEFSMHHSVRHENCITALFHAALLEAYVTAGRSWFVTLEDPIVDPTFGTEEGRNDLNFYPPEHHGQKIFFTVECKRLHVTTASGFSHLADAYVDAGMRRFVCGGYSRGLPCGGMLGYVMDGKVEVAFDRVREAIAARATSLHMLAGRPIATPSETLPRFAFSADTIHLRCDGEFIIHHALVAVII